MRRVRFLLWVGLLCVGVGSTAQGQIHSNVIYGHKDGMALFYDVYQPEEANGAGVLFMVSGGWFSIWQPPEQRLPMLQPLLDAGFTVFAVHHGSAPRFKVPDAVSDVRAAVRHVKVNASEYGVDPDRIGVYGGSAGGHLSLMLGLNAEGKPIAPPEGRGRALGPVYASADSDGRVAAVVAYFPPVDLRPLVGPSERFPALDFPETDAASISPIRFVSDDDPPVLLIHGDADDLVPISNSQVLAKELEATGVVHDFITIEGAGHGFQGDDRVEATRAMVGWFQQHLTAD
jgi:acetyl esterase/lipase